MYHEELKALFYSIYFNPTPNIQDVVIVGSSYLFARKEKLEAMVYVNTSLSSSPSSIPRISRAGGRKGGSILLSICSCFFFSVCSEDFGSGRPSE